jgi:hypothetical protein
MTEDIARAAGVACHRSKVGEANVVEVMERHGAVLGGEGNGGVIDPRIGYVRDSFIGMAMILEMMAARTAPLSQLAAELPHYEIVKGKVGVAREAMPRAWDALQAECSEATPDRLDGLRLDWPDRWLLVRGSNTEPIVRLFAEAPTRAAAEELCRRAEQALRPFSGCHEVEHVAALHLHEVGARPHHGARESRDRHRAAGGHQDRAARARERHVGHVLHEHDVLRRGCVRQGEGGDRGETCETAHA